MMTLDTDIQTVAGLEVFEQLGANVPPDHTDRSYSSAQRHPERRRDDHFFHAIADGLRLSSVMIVPEPTCLDSAIRCSSCVSACRYLSCVAEPDFCDVPRLMADTDMAP